MKERIGNRILRAGQHAPGHFLLPLPGLARQQREDSRLDELEGPVKAPIVLFGEQGAYVTGKDGVVSLLVKILLENRPRYPVVLVLHVPHEGLGDLGCIGCMVGFVEGVPEVEQVPPLLPLVERPQFRGQKLLGVVGEDVRPPREPAPFDRKRQPFEPEYGEVFSRVDLHLQLEGQPVLGSEPVEQGNAAFAAFTLGRAEPAVQTASQLVYDMPDGSRFDLHEVDVFRITGWRQVELEQGCAPSEGQIF